MTDNKLVLQTTVKTVRDGDITYKWSIEQGVVSDGGIKTGDNLAYFVVMTDNMTPGGQYTFKCTISDGVASAVDEFKVKVNSPPHGGYLEFVSDDTANGGNTITLSAINWDDEQTPLSYAFGLVKSSGDIQLLTSFKDNTATQSIVLPVGTYTLAVVIKDATGAKTISTSDAFGLDVTKTIDPPLVAKTGVEVSNAIANALLLGDTDTAVGTLTSQMVVDPCKSINCGLQGVCQSGGNLGYTCVCTATWTGDLCEIPPPGQKAPVKICLNNCSENGSCATYPEGCLSSDEACIAECTCNSGFFGNDCSVNQAAKDKKNELVTGLLSSIDTLVSMMDSTPESLLQSSSLISGVASTGEGLLSAEQIASVTALTTSLVKAASTLEVVPQEIAEQVIATIGSISSSGTSETRRRMRMLVDSTEKAFGNQLINNITFATAKNLLPGEPAKIITTPTITVSVLASTIGQSGSMMVGTKVNSTVVNVPSGFLQQQNIGSLVSAPPTVQIHSIAFKSDPHQGAVIDVSSTQTAANGVTATVISMDVFSSADKSRVEVKNLAAPGIYL